jgi:hypothetical protein
MSSKNFFARLNHEEDLGLCLLSADMVFSNWLSNSFCLCVRLTGVSTTTLHSKSPVAPPRTGGTPIPFRRNTLSDCVSAGTFNLTLPFSVGTSSSPPNAATIKLMGTSQCKLMPSRSNKSCWRTRLPHLNVSGHPYPRPVVF